MAANLTQQYYRAEKAYRLATSPREELDCLQTMLVELPKHKGTDKIHADLKQKISRLRKIIAAGGKAVGKNTPPSTNRIPRQGAGRAIIIGAPNSGKSQLLASLTNAKPVVADYPFSTTQSLPGMMAHEDVYVQLIDTPPITADVFDTSTLELIRGADLVLLMLDLGSDDGGEQLLEIVQKVNESKSRLGTETRIDEGSIGVTITETILLNNKIDLAAASDRLQFFDELIDLPFESHCISAIDPRGLGSLANRVYDAMNVVRVYTKHPSQKQPDMDTPLTIKNGQTLADLAQLIHGEFAGRLKGARIWGANVHDGSTVNSDYVLSDKDIVELQL